MSLQIRYRKRGQGTVVRTTAGIALTGLVAFGCAGLADTITADWWQTVLWMVPFFEFQIELGAVVSFLVFLLGTLGVYLYVVNHPAVSDFLISTESELRKVSWPEAGEFVNAAIVVLITIFIITGYLAVIDIIFVNLMEVINVLPNV